MNDDKYPIIKNIPIPGRPGISNLEKYPFIKLEVGDSFFIRGEHKKAPGSLCATANKKLKPKKFSARNVDGGIRVWRVI